MTRDGASSIVLNPSTPLAFLPPALADQYQNACFVAVVCFSVNMHHVNIRETHDPIQLLQAFAWDWLMSIAQEYKVVRHSRFNVLMIAYILSRSVKTIIKVLRFITMYSALELWDILCVR